MESSNGHDGADPAVEGVRLQKLMAAAGIASRRVSENLIAAGRVEVNGEVVTEPGRRVVETDAVSVDGTPIQLDTTRRYLMLNKPEGVVSSLSDDRGRPDLSRFVSDFEERLFNVGRLDAQTTGLLILTNDGDLAHVLAHPSFGVMKTYVAKTKGHITPQTVAKLRKGVELEDGPIAADKARIVGEARAHETIIEVTLHSGRNRIVRRMLEEVGHPVIDLVRRQFGPLHLGNLAPGEIRDLTKEELGQLLAIARDSTEATEATEAAASASEVETVAESGGRHTGQDAESASEVSSAAESGGRHRGQEGGGRGR